MTDDVTLRALAHLTLTALECTAPGERLAAPDLVRRFCGRLVCTQAGERSKNKAANETALYMLRAFLARDGDE